MHTFFRFLAFAALLWFAAPVLSQAASVSCAYYEIPELPEGWTSSMPPELNNEEHHSLGHYYNNRLNASLMIQIAETRKKNATLDEVTSDVLNSLKTNGCTILSAPVNDGTLRRLDVTLTGKTKGTIWIGTDSDLMALTVAAGNVGACREFLKNITNASPLLLPVESK